MKILNSYDFKIYCHKSWLETAEKNAADLKLKNDRLFYALTKSLIPEVEMIGAQKHLAYLIRKNDAHEKQILDLTMTAGLWNNLFSGTLKAMAYVKKITPKAFGSRLFKTWDRMGLLNSFGAENSCGGTTSVEVFKISANWCDKPVLLSGRGVDDQEPKMFLEVYSYIKKYLRHYNLTKSTSLDEFTKILEKTSLVHKNGTIEYFVRHCGKEVPNCDNINIASYLRTQPQSISSLSIFATMYFFGDKNTLDRFNKRRMQVANLLRKFKQIGAS